MASTFLASGAFVTHAAAAVAPEAGAVKTIAPRKYEPRRGFLKRDPVEALLPVRFRGQGLVPNVDILTGDLIVKFRDGVKARAPITGGELSSLSGADMTAAQSLLSEFGGQARQWIRKSTSDLDSIEYRAREQSGRDQPDLAGMILVSGVSLDNLYRAAIAINALDLVEFVTIEARMHNLQTGCDPDNPATCDVPSPSCSDPFPGTDAINRTMCNPDPNANPRPYGCNDITCCQLVGNIDPTCNDQNDTGGWDVYCAAWANMLCSGSVYSPPPDDGPYDPCFYDETAPNLVDPIFDPVYATYQNGSCVNPHTGKGCNQPACCAAVCVVDPVCCDTGWNATCANLVLSGQFSTCVIPQPTDDSSPDLTPQQTPQGLQGFQYYLQSGPRPQTLVDVANVGETWAGADFSGHGLALAEMDEFQNTIWQFYQQGDPTNNPYLKGGTIKVGILESSGLVAHEDFLLAGPAKNATRPWEGPLLSVPKVIQEPGVSPIFLENGFISANHGTNVMGVVVAAENGFGVTGIASRAQGYFFPTVSLESGFRAQDAMASALLEFGAGDVLNFSWGFQGGLPYFAAPNTPTITFGGGRVNPVTQSEAFSTLIGVATDLGITSVVAAGAGPDTIQGSTDQDVGAIIVTAVWPGSVLPGARSEPGYECCAPIGGLAESSIAYVRWPFSNYEGDGAQNPDETADASAWGFAIATTGATTNYNNSAEANTEVWLFRGTNDQPPSSVASGLQVDRLRTYTQGFGGTSGAAAMITGVAARVQAAAKQFYGTAILPAQVRQVINSSPSSFGQCLGATGDTPDKYIPDLCAPADICGLDECTPNDCACTFHTVGNLVNMQQMPGTILNSPFFDGNTTNVEVLTGGQLIGYSWNSFQIRATDGNYLRIVAQPRTAGTIVDGLAYLSTGRTTDVRVKKQVTIPLDTVTSLGIRVISRATQNFVLAGVFVYNNDRQRYEFFGARLLTVADQLIAIPLPQTAQYGPYINSSDKTVKMRLWTCGLGSVGRHVVLHDLIDIDVNVPLNPL